MATCPRCGGFLHEHHRCRGRWRRRTRSAVWTLAGAASGSAIAFAIVERPALGLIVTCAALGAVLVAAVRQFAKF